MNTSHKRAKRSTVGRTLAQRIGLILALAFTGASAATVGGAQAADSTWTATALGDPPSTAMAVNDAGVVAGMVGMGASSRAVVWDSEGVMTYLSMPEGATSSTAYAINNLGRVAGQVNTSSSQEAVVWESDGSITQLGFLPGGTSFSSAHDINDSGKVVGVASLTGHYRAFVWDGDGPIEALPIPSDMTDTYGDAINNLDQVVGSAGAMYQPSRAVLWEDGVATALEPLAEGAPASATNLNDLGQIVGNSATTSAPWLVRNPVLWDDGVVIDLGSLGGAQGVAYAINNNGQIAGFGLDAANQLHAFVWEDGVRTLLEPLAGDSQTFARDVSATGQIVGWSGPPGAASRAVIWRSAQTPAEQVADLIALVESYNLDKLGTSLTDKLATVQRMLEANKPTQACESLDAFINQIEAHTDKGLTVDQASELTSKAQDIKTAIGCTP